MKALTKAAEKRKDQVKQEEQSGTKGNSSRIYMEAANTRAKGDLRRTRGKRCLALAAFAVNSGHLYAFQFSASMLRLLML